MARQSTNPITADLPLSSFRLVTIWFRHTIQPTQHIVHESDVLPMMKALQELHHSPGVNPHSGEKASEAVEIHVEQFAPAGPFWWTTPGLQKNDEQFGATLMQGSRTTIYWRRDEATANDDVEPLAA